MENNIIGHLFAERYEILAEIGNGGMAKVYKAKDTLLNRFVAIKILRSEFLGDEEFTARFISEAQAAASLAQQNLVSIYDAGTSLGNKFIVMEYVDGITLKEYIKSSAPVKWSEAVDIAIQILHGIAHAHERGIIHRDIKPQNIMITKKGLVKVTDFGIARATSGYTQKIGDSTIGSVHYFSPEQARGRHTDEKSDIYSLGIVLFEMLTARLPFDGESPISVAMMHLNNAPPSLKDFNVTIPLSVCDIVLKAMRKDTTERYQSASSMLFDLETVKMFPDSSPVVDSPRDTAGDTQVMKSVQTVAFLDEENPVAMPPEAYIPHDKKTLREQELKRAIANNKGEKEKKKNKTLAIWAIASASFLVFSIVIAVIYALFPNVFLPQNTAEVPNLVGMSFDEAKELYDGTEIKIIEGSTRADSVAEKGVILEQNPAYGKKVKTPMEITVVVSEGIKTVILSSDLIGKDERTFNSMLADMGLNIVWKHESSMTVAEGIVMKISPPVGSTVKYGDEIEVTLSSGAQGEEITMPNLIGLMQDEAKKVLEQKKLILGSKRYAASDYDADVVIEQSVEKGETITEFSTVDVVISNGEKPSTPAPTPETIHSRTISIAIPQDKDVTIVKVAVDGKTEFEEVKRKSEGTEFSFTIRSTKKEVSVEVYYDGALKRVTTVPLV